MDVGPVTAPPSRAHPAGSRRRAGLVASRRRPRRRSRRSHPRSRCRAGRCSAEGCGHRPRPSSRSRPRWSPSATRRRPLPAPKVKVPLSRMQTMASASSSLLSSRSSRSAGSSSTSATTHEAAGVHGAGRNRAAHGRAEGRHNTEAAIASAKKLEAKSRAVTRSASCACGVRGARRGSRARDGAAGGDEGRDRAWRVRVGSGLRRHRDPPHERRLRDGLRADHAQRRGPGAHRGRVLPARRGAALETAEPSPRRSSGTARRSKSTRSTCRSESA